MEQSQYISAKEAAERLGISPSDVAKLVSQEILHPAQQNAGGDLFAIEDIERIVSNREPTISEEAAQIGVQIQQEVVYSVSSLQQLKRRVSILTGLTVVSLLISVCLVTALFKLYPEQTSDFFGYYYRFNAGNRSEILSPSLDNFQLAGTTVDPSTNNTNISLAASLTKPIAAMSLLVVKATDGQQYKQIVEVPIGSASIPGPAGSPGQPGANGINGTNGLTGPSGLNGAAGHDGQAGAAGSDGINGTNGADGTNGTNGTNGVDGVNGTNGINGINGTSVADVTTTPGDIIIRDGGNITTRLGAGSDGQILTIVGGIPAWINDTGLTAESDSLASVTARGASTSAALTLSSSANDFTLGTLRLNGDVITDLSGSGLTVSGNTLGVGGLTNANLSGSAGISNANLANSSVTINTSGPLSGGGSVTLGGPALTLGISSNPTFTTVNGLIITSNGSNTLSIAAGKTFGVNNSLVLSGVDGTSFSLPSTSDTLVGRSSSDTLLNKVISAGSNTISGLTNTNLSGSAGISNANLANSGLSLAGNSGSGSVALGGGLTFSGSGITNITASGSTLTVATNEADTLASVTARGTSTGANLTFSGGLTFSGSVTFSSLTNCRTLATNASGVLGCGDTTGDGAAFTDSSPATIADNDTTELFNDATKPKITPTVSSQTVLVSVHARFTGGGTSDTDAAVRIVRNIGSAASCSGSTQVGDSFSTFMTNSTDTQSASGTFLDSPATTSQVFYTICSSADSRLGSAPSSNRVDVTLVRVGR